MPQLMRMVLNESLKALKTRGWEERLVLAAHPRRLLLAGEPSGRGDWAHVFLLAVRHEERSAFPVTGGPMVLEMRHF